jgi:hypothetical protein
MMSCIGHALCSPMHSAQRWRNRLPLNNAPRICPPGEVDVVQAGTGELPRAGPARSCQGPASRICTTSH